MGLRMNHFAYGTALAIGLSAGAIAAGEEPSEAQMKEAMLYAMNHPPGITNVAPITITFFKKEGCENPTPRGYSCGFDVTVASTNIGASMYNNISMGIFYLDKDSGKWVMRPPF
jgi:hypothetical protein